MLTETSLIEVKNVNYLSLTSQLRDFYLHTQKNNLDFILYVRPSTTLSKSLQELIEQRKIIIKFIPGTKWMMKQF